jgi:Domain of unknown function (DUF6265)
MRAILLSALALTFSSSASPLRLIPGASTASPPSHLPTSTSVSDLTWLEGVWRGEIGGRQFEARYTSPEGGQILSASKYTEKGKPAGFEFERFEQRGDTVLLTPFPQGKSSVTFPLTDYNAKGHRAVFENLAHDFPTRISYQLLGKDRLTILVSGPGEDGNEQVLIYSLRRQ